MSQPQFALKSYQFRKEREQSWRELTRLVEKVERQGLRALSSEEAYRLAALYRGGVSSLSVARAISLDRNLLEYLDALVARAYVAVYTSKRPAGQTVLQFLRDRFPRSVREHGKFVIAATLLFALGTLAGLALTLADPELYYSFVSREMAGDRNPAASAETLRATLYDTGSGADGLQAFAAFLFTHNAKIGILCFALGFAAGAPVIGLLIYNGLTLGAMAAVFQMKGLGFEFWAWVMPHGVTELGAVCLCGGAGLSIGYGMIFPGRRTRLDSLARHGRLAANVVIGSVLLFFIAALIEGFFRQLVQSVPVRCLVVLATALGWTAYFGLLGRGPAEVEA